MTDQEVLRNVEGLERWYRSFAPPRISAGSLRALKLVVGCVLEAADGQPTDAACISDDVKRGIKSCIRETLLRSSEGLVERPAPILHRLSSWLASAAALVFVVAGYGLLSKNSQFVAESGPIVLETPITSEMTAIEAGLVDLELQSLATDLLLAGANEVDGDLFDRIERLLAPSSYLYETR